MDFERRLTVVSAANIRSSRLEIIWKKDRKERANRSYHKPVGNDHGCRICQPPGAEELREMLPQS